MSESEKFLTRWSRKKLEATDIEAPATPKSADDAAATAQPERSDRSAERLAARPAPSAPKEAFDLASLPSIESITEATDVRAFLAPGVPPELTRAALRRAWLADPAIRDFVGLQEYDGDFNTAVGLPGFGDLPAGIDIKKLVARIFGEAETPAEENDAPRQRPGSPPDAQALDAQALDAQALDAQALDAQALDAQALASSTDAQAIEIANVSASEGGPDAARPPAVGASDRPTEDQATPAIRNQDDIVQCENHTAAQQSIREANAQSNTILRPHGRALPK